MELKPCVEVDVFYSFRDLGRTVNGKPAYEAIGWMTTSDGRRIQVPVEFVEAVDRMKRESFKI